MQIWTPSNDNAKQHCHSFNLQQQISLQGHCSILHYMCSTSLLWSMKIGLVRKKKSISEHLHWQVALVPLGGTAASRFPSQGSHREFVSATKAGVSSKCGWKFFFFFFWQIKIIFPVLSPRVVIFTFVLIHFWLQLPFESKEKKKRFKKTSRVMRRITRCFASQKFFLKKW